MRERAPCSKSGAKWPDQYRHFVQSQSRQSIADSRCSILFCVRVALPDPKRVTLGVLTDREVSHLRHCGFRHADFSAKFRNFVAVLVHRIDADVVDDWLLWLFAPFQRTVRSVVGAAGIDVPVIARSGKWIHLPAKQIAIKRLGAFGIVRRDFKPNDACILFEIPADDPERAK